MSTKFLGKVIAGAALGGASLLVWAPSTALADGGYHPTDGYQNNGSGRVLAEPHAAKPGQEITFTEVCAQAQQHAWLWSKVTGKVDLAPRDHTGHPGADRKADDGWDTGEHGGKSEDPGGHGSVGDDYEVGDDYKKESEYQDFLRYKEYQEYQEYRRYRDKADSTPAEDGTPRVEDARPAPAPGAGAVPAPAPSPSPRPQQPADDYQPPAGQPGSGGTGGMAADDGWSAEQGDHGGKAEEGAHGKAREGDHGAWDRSEKAGGSDHGAGDQSEKAGFEYWANVTIPWDAKPGTYELKGSCGEGELVVTPKGWVDGGDGGITAGDTDNLAVAGVGMLGMAALGGLVLMRPRRTDDSAG